MFKKLGLPALLGIACVIFAFFLSGAAGVEARGALIDIPSFIISIIIPFLIVLVSFGYRATSRAFSSPFNATASRTELKLAKAWFASFMRYIIAFSVFAVVIGTVMIMVYASGEDSTVVGKNFAVSVLSIFYASVVPIFFVLPFLQAIDMRLAETE